MSQGSALGSIFNAASLVLLELESQTNYVNSASRLSTSSGADVDSFILPFGLSRRAATPATGLVQFSTPSILGIGQSVTILVGVQVQTATGVVYTVVANPALPGYNSATNSYTISQGNNSVIASVTAVIPGTSGNVQANTITQILGTPLYPAPAAVNAVTNSAAFTSGTNVETDAAYIARFSAFISSRYATTPAINEAVESLALDLTYQVLDSMDQFGNALPNFFSVIVNTANINYQDATVLQPVINAVLAARPSGVPFQVVNPQLLPVAVTANLSITPGANAAVVNSNATVAVTNYLNGIGLNINGLSTTAQFSEITSILIGLPGVSNVTLLTLNGGTSDQIAPVGYEIVSSTITFTNN
jgi:hypothetical protein